jgi:hypothetical protein
MEERRSGDRKRVMVTTTVRKRKDNDEVEIMEFRSRDLCIGGIFVSTEDLSLFQLGEELEILIDDDGRKYYKGRARVVRSARVLSGQGELTDSGFGLMFTSPDPDFIEIVQKKLGTP